MNIRMAGLGLALLALIIVDGDRAQAASRTQLSEQEMIERFDTNGDGALSNTERTVARQIMQAMRREGTLNSSAEQVRKVIARFDANGDEEISASELSTMLAAAREHHHATTMNADLRDNSFVSRFDANGDGRLDPAETAIAPTALANQANMALTLGALSSRLSASTAASPGTAVDAGTGTGAGEPGGACGAGGGTDGETTGTSTVATTRSSSANRTSRATQLSSISRFRASGIAEPGRQAGGSSNRAFNQRNALTGSSAPLGAGRLSPAFTAGLRGGRGRR